MRTIRDQTPRRHSACSDRFLAELFRGPYHMLYHHLRPCCCLLFSQTRCLVEPATTCSSGPSSVWQMLTCCPPPLLHLHGKSHKYIYHKLFKGERKKCPLLVLVAHTLDWEESVESVDGNKTFLLQESSIKCRTRANCSALSRRRHHQLTPTTTAANTSTISLT